MSELISFSPAAQIRGEEVAAFIAGFPQEVQSIGVRALENHGLSAPKAGDFYPLQKFLDAMKEISDKFSAQMLFRIGEQIARHAAPPPGIDNLPQALSAVDAAYHIHHRGGEIGGYQFKHIGTQDGLEKASMICADLNPCAFDLRVIEGFAKRFKPAGSSDIVARHGDTQPCRQKGMESCTYIISWM